jgi:hypothetical protein
MSVAVSKLPVLGKKFTYYITVKIARYQHVPQFPYLMLTNTVMPKEEAAWNLPLKTTERTRDVAFIQTRHPFDIKSSLRKYIEIFFIYNVRAYEMNA